MFSPFYREVLGAREENKTQPSPEALLSSSKEHLFRSHFLILTILSYACGGEIYHVSIIQVCYSVYLQLLAVNIQLDRQF